MTDIIYDIETYPNVFTCVLITAHSGNHTLIEVSERCNDWLKFVKLMKAFKDNNCRMVGFNNLGFDYPVIHTLLSKLKPDASAKDVYEMAFKKCEDIIDTPWNDRFRHNVWDNECFVQQIDLYKIHHFDNMARATSLKEMEFNMRSESIQDLPYPPGTVLAPDEIGELLTYNLHDGEETLKFYNLSKDQIEFREQLSKQYDRNFLNHNDTRIGKDYFMMELGITNRTTTTPRSKIDLGELILDQVRFVRPEFNAVTDWIADQVITQTKKVFTEIPIPAISSDLAQYANMELKNDKVKNLNVVVDGFQFDFGTGGIHGSVRNRAFESDDTMVIKNVDVASYYPNLAIANGLYPEHLGERFCEVYKDVYEQRKTYPKGTPENAMLKLALNGVYGDSNNQYSAFYDPRYTMAITINGQLLLCMLAEALLDIPDLEIININTDGICVHVPRRHVEVLQEHCQRWEGLTGLTLETDEYARLWQRDVNNYLGVTV